jgi:putative NIF3 family GTP cyclohydrolase 1 type 2
MQAELFFTGEMRHHDVLGKVAQGSSVILCEHTHTERGYLPRLRTRLLELLPTGLEISVANSDREPLGIV